MNRVIESIERRQMRPNIPQFKAGDTVRVHFQVIEGQRRRTQVFEGIVLKRQGSGVHETFTVRKQSFGVGVERTFPLHSPKIEQLEIAARGDVRRAKLYYLRDRVGKAARVAERRWGIGEEVLGSADGEAVDAEGATQVEAPQAVPVEGDGEEGVQEVQEVEQTEAPETEAQADEEAQAEAPQTDVEAEAQADAGGDQEAGEASEPDGEPEGEAAESEDSDADDEASRQDA
jgi:large subunit ribosomal protein L19